MARRNVYTISYRMLGGTLLEETISVIAESKADAYGKAFYEAIPEKEGEMPYSAWVTSVTYQNGNVHHFNTCEGLAY